MKPLGVSIVSFVKNRQRLIAGLSEEAAPGLNCEGCTACCKSYGDIRFREGDDPSLFTSDGRLPMKAGTERECAYLGENGCTVYGRRPWECRTYDCRTLAVTGLISVNRPELQEAVSEWDLTDGIRTTDDVDSLMCVTMARDQFCDEGFVEERALTAIAMSSLIAPPPPGLFSVHSAREHVTKTRRQLLALIEQREGKAT